MEIKAYLTLIFIEVCIGHIRRPAHCGGEHCIPLRVKQEVTGQRRLPSALLWITYTGLGLEPPEGFTGISSFMDSVAGENSYISGSQTF